MPGYTRLNHLDNCLTEMTRVHSEEVPDDVLNMVRAEMVRKAIAPESLRYFGMRNILKELGLEKYIDNAYYIINEVKGVTQLPPPIITDELKEQIRGLFIAITVKPLSYNYMIYKLCEILKANEVLKCIPMAKSDEKIRLQDQKWREVCVQNNWPYYDTIV